MGYSLQLEHAQQEHAQQSNAIDSICDKKCPCRVCVLKQNTVLGLTIGRLSMLIQRGPFVLRGSCNEHDGRFTPQNKKMDIFTKAKEWLLGKIER